MSNRQLLVFKRRIFDKLSPDELKEMKGDPNELSLNVKQRQLVSRFIDKELENRRDNPFERALKK